MRILVVGAGALGGLVGASLAEAGEDTVMVEINAARARLLNETGLFISREGEPERCVKLKVVTSVEGLDPVDLVFISVKSYQTEAAVRGVMSVIGPGTRVLSLQNGIGNTDTMARIIGPERVLCGITYHSIQHTGPNRLRYRPGIKPIQIAPYDGKVTTEIEQIGTVFRQAGLDTDVVDNIDHVTWQKLLHNAVVNPVSAVTGLSCREMLADEDLMAFMRDLCMEIIAVMRAHGVPIVDEEDPFRPVIGSLKALGKNRPSMWQDLARGARTEVDAINGAIYEEACKLGLPAPHNCALVHFIHSRERQKILRRQEITKTLEQTKKRQKSEPLPRTLPTGMAIGGGMPSGRVPLETAPKLKEMVRESFRKLQEAADDPSRKIACCSGMGPVEIVRALGLTPYFPENHAALIAASRLSGRYIPRALAEGFSQFVNSGMACDIGALLAGHSPLVSAHGIAGPPRPDVVVYSTNNGHSLIRWFEYYGTHFEVPVFGLHPPAALGEVGRIEVDAAGQQMMRLTRRLEEVSGTRLDIDRLAEIVHHSAQASALWTEILGLARTVPSPVTVFDLLIHLGPMILMRGTPEAVEYYRILKAEIEQRVAEKMAAVPGERFRFYWEGPPIWCALRPLARLFLETRVAVVASSFFGNFDLAGLDPDNPIESMARAYTSIFPNRSDAFKSEQLAGEFEAYGVDAVVYHEDRTCPEHSNVRHGLEVQMRRKTGLPSLILEADSHDLRLFSMDRLNNQLRDFIESQQEVGGVR
ncbi:MAG TPA: 2-dehydropantoate 2-reductase [Acidobacteria bacterium]|nr:2-dehydropantoate 2-reductase [Acidobacteriota bacterium]